MRDVNALLLSSLSAKLRCTIDAPEIPHHAMLRRAVDRLIEPQGT